MLLVFVGERRSPAAIRMGVRWPDGRLAAKQLFDALRAPVRLTAASALLITEERA